MGGAWDLGERDGEARRERRCALPRIVAGEGAGDGDRSGAVAGGEAGLLLGPAPARLDPSAVFGPSALRGRVRSIRCLTKFLAAVATRWAAIIRAPAPAIRRSRRDEAERKQAAREREQGRLVPGLCAPESAPEPSPSADRASARRAPPCPPPSAPPRRARAWSSSSPCGHEQASARLVPPGFSGSLPRWRGRSSSTRWRWRLLRRRWSGSNIAIWMRSFSASSSTSPCSRPASSRSASGPGDRLTPRPAPAGFERNEAAIRSLGLSPRECEILALLASGQSNKEMARTLGISPNTVKTHVARVLREARGAKARPGDRESALALAHPLGDSHFHGRRCEARITRSGDGRSPDRPNRPSRHRAASHHAGG